MLAAAVLVGLSATAPLVQAIAIRQTTTPAPYTLSSLTSCPKADVYSCENATAVANTCCSPTPGGLVLTTQFWNTYTGLEKEGQLLPARHWGIHGLWPDNCDGTYESYCDLSRQLDPEPSPNKTEDGSTILPWTGETATSILKRFGRHDLLSYMQGYWIARGQKSEVLWAHEYGKHATCFSTFDKECYPDWEFGLDAVDYFSAAVRAHKQYPSFEILASHGILPSNSTRYTLDALNAAFESQVGAVPYFGCDRDANGDRTVLSEIWVYAHVLGTPQMGQYKAIDTTYPSTCSNATDSIWYYRRSAGSEVSKYN